MESMSPAEIAMIIEPMLKAAGVDPLTMEVKPYGEAPFDTLPVVDVRVDSDVVGRAGTVTAFGLFERAFNRRFGCQVRLGFYGPDMHDDLQEGQLLVELDQLPFDLVAAVSPKPVR